VGIASIQGVVYFSMTGITDITDTTDSTEGGGDSEEWWTTLTEEESAALEADRDEVLAFDFQELTIRILSASQLFSYCEHEYYAELLELAYLAQVEYVKYVKQFVGGDTTAPHPFEGYITDEVVDISMSTLESMAQIPTFAELLGPSLLEVSPSEEFSEDVGITTLDDEWLSLAGIFERYREIYAEVRTDAEAGLLTEGVSDIVAAGLLNLAEAEKLAPCISLAGAGDGKTSYAAEMAQIPSILFTETRKRLFSEIGDKLGPVVIAAFEDPHHSFEGLLEDRVHYWVLRELAKYAYSDEDAAALMSEMLSSLSGSRYYSAAERVLPWEYAGEVYAKYTKIRYSHFFDQLLDEFPVSQEPFREYLMALGSEELQAKYELEVEAAKAAAEAAEAAAGSGEESTGEESTGEESTGEESTGEESTGEET
jgi:hypothetical protein